MGAGRCHLPVEQRRPHGDAVRALGYSLAVVPRVSGFDVGRIVALRRLLRQQAADVVHAVNWFASGYAVLAKPRGARVISRFATVICRPVRCAGWR